MTGGEGKASLSGSSRAPLLPEAGRRWDNPLEGGRNSGGVRETRVSTSRSSGPEWLVEKLGQACRPVSAPLPGLPIEAYGPRLPAQRRALFLGYCPDPALSLPFQWRCPLPHSLWHSEPAGRSQEVRAPLQRPPSLPDLKNEGHLPNRASSGQEWQPQARSWGFGSLSLEWGGGRREGLQTLQVSPAPPSSRTLGAGSDPKPRTPRAPLCPVDCGQKGQHQNESACSLEVLPHSACPLVTRAEGTRAQRRAFFTVSGALTPKQTLWGEGCLDLVRH